MLWGMTLRLLDDLVPRLLAGEWPRASRASAAVAAPELLFDPLGIEPPRSQ